MKKLISIVLCILILTAMLSGCGTAGSLTNAKKSVVVTIFPIYDWVINLLGDRAAEWNVTFLLDNGVDLHSYQPTAEDMIQISSCDLFIYVGGASDNWVNDAIKGAVNPSQQTVSLIEILGSDAKEEELVEGMEAEAEEECEDREAELDEHVWLSLRNAERFCAEIVECLKALDPDGTETYAANAQSYLAQLQALDTRYTQTVERAANRTLLFGDRFPFRYLTDDYGLDYYAAFVGCSAESEASFETVIFLAGKVDELSLPAIVALEGTKHDLASTILENTTKGTAQIVTMNSMQSTTRADADAGQSYLGIMEENLTALALALG